jgi:hypothetical protein
MKRSTRILIYLVMIMVAVLAGMSLGITVAFAVDEMACPPIDEHKEKLFQYVLGGAVTLSSALTSLFVYTNHDNNKNQWEKINELMVLKGEHEAKKASCPHITELLQKIIDAKGL